MKKVLKKLIKRLNLPYYFNSMQEAGRMATSKHYLKLSPSEREAPIRLRQRLESHPPANRRPRARDESLLPSRE